MLTEAGYARSNERTEANSLSDIDSRHSRPVAELVASLEQLGEEAVDELKQHEQVCVNPGPGPGPLRSSSCMSYIGEIC